MTLSHLEHWTREFRKTAKADHYALLRDHLSRLELPECPELLLDGTIQVVHASAAYAKVDGKSFAAFLDMQTYDPREAEGAKYAFTFDLCGKAFGRVMVSDKVGILDLADLYNHPWNDYNVCGYYSIYIARLDGKILDSKDLARLEKEVTDDLLFDYCEDELDLWFDDQSLDGVLKAVVHDRES
jgi:hypothetical protein